MNHIYITPNQRLQRRLLQQLQQTESIKNSTWKTPTVLSFEAWIKEIWHTHRENNLSETRQLLNTNQIYQIWSEIIANNETYPSSNTVKTAIKAWTQLQQWQIDLCDLPAEQTVLEKTFTTWAKQYQVICEEKHWLDPNSLIKKIINDELVPYQSAPSTITLYNFIDLTPIQKKLIDWAKSKNISIETYNNVPVNETEHAYEFATAPEEITTIAKWAKALYDSGEKEIACIFPNLSKDRSMILHHFEQVFFGEPSINTAEKEKPFNISAGQTLTQFPIIQETLLLLSVLNNTIKPDEAYSLIKSPMLSTANTSLSQRERIATNYYENITEELSLEQLLQYLEHTQSDLTSTFKQLQTLHQNVCQQRKLPSQWASIFSKALITLGWPGEESLSSAEFQLVSRFNELLQEIASLDTIKPKSNLKQALSILIQLANNTTFQFQSSNNGIEILGSLEASGMQFNHCWIASISEDNFPAPASANPFIPKKIQRTHGMPHASAERELEFCSQLINQLTSNSQHIIMSYSKLVDNKECYPSVFINTDKISAVSTLTLNSVEATTKTLFKRSSLTTLADDIGTPFNKPSLIKGGTSVIKTQASCPFKAYATHRLSAHSPQKAQPGLSGAVRGEIIHSVLEKFWQKIKTKQALLSLTANQINNLINTLAAQVISNHLAPTSKLFQIETTRVKNLITKWLDYEKERDDFKVIATEKTLSITTGKLSMNMRADRIDSLDNGKTIIIDYKTANTSINNFFGYRPEEPQLPLYCINSDTPPKALLFAQITPNQLAFKGVSDCDTIILNTTSIDKAKNSDGTSWEEQISLWKDMLISIAHEFEQGVASVTPKSTITSCQYCGLHSLCRINEDQYIAMEEGDE